MSATHSTGEQRGHSKQNEKKNRDYDCDREWQAAEERWWPWRAQARKAQEARANEEKALEVKAQEAKAQEARANEEKAQKMKT